MSYEPGQLPETRDHVRQHISACCSATDDPNEFAIEVAITERIEGEGVMVFGELVGHEAKADYLEPGYEPFEDALFHFGRPSTVADPVDLTPEQLEIHLAEKAAR